MHSIEFINKYESSFEYVAEVKFGSKTFGWTKSCDANPKDDAQLLKSLRAQAMEVFAANPQHIPAEELKNITFSELS
jgi:hypothetical protein